MKRTSDRPATRIACSAASLLRTEGVRLGAGRRRLASALTAALLLAGGCGNKLLDQAPARDPDKTMPGDFGKLAGDSGSQTSVAAQAQWDAFFSDADLKALIEEALDNNQELNMQLQEIIITRNEIAAKRGDYLPSLGAGVGGGVEKVGRYSSQGVSDELHGVPANLPNLHFGFSAAWEIDIWGKLRNAMKSAKNRYLASIEARNFIVTQIVAEIAEAYYELVALDNQIEVLDRNIALQTDALEIVKLKKEAARATELAVQRFQAEVLKNQAHRFMLEQRRIEAENRINFLVGRYPQPVKRNPAAFNAAPPRIYTGVPSELLANRPDIRQAELELEASKLDVKVAKARFYPSLSIEAGVGYDSFNMRHLVATPQSLAYNVAGNLMAPLLNRAAIKADYRAANAAQIRAVYNYERTILLGYTEVANNLAKIENLRNEYERLAEQVAKLQTAIEVSSVLYDAARADYMEVLLTRRDSLDAEMELIETKKDQLLAVVKVYQALGGGWRKPK